MSMIENVARALQKIDGICPYVAHEIAIAAITAMLEPTDGMLSEYWSSKQKVMCSDVYKAMIQAALDEK